MRPGCVQVDGELLERLLVRDEVEKVVLFELSVRKTLEGRQCGCRDLALAFPINTRTALLGTPATAKTRPNAFTSRLSSYNL
jgi:hypothetical protein